MYLKYQPSRDTKKKKKYYGVVGEHKNKIKVCYLDVYVFWWIYIYKYILWGAIRSIGPLRSGLLGLWPIRGCVSVRGGQVPS